MNEILTYYSSVIAIVIITQITALILVAKNNNINPNKRKGFILTFSLLIWATILEWSSHTILAQPFSYLIPIRKIVKAIELSIAPIILVECAFNVFSIKIPKKEKIIVKTFLIFQSLLEFASIPFGFIFTVTNNNTYLHGSCYFIYTFSLIISGAFLVYKVIKFCNHYQNQNVVILFLMMTILGIGSIIRLMNSEIRLDWLTTTIVTIFLYIYYNDIAMHIDFLTKMLNQRSYNNELEVLSFPAIIIIFDINDFKNINDTYGHTYGDEIITLVGSLIKKVFHSSGKSYRIGGDEFAVLQTKNLDEVETLLNNLCTKLDEKREKDFRIPNVSYGIARYDNEYQYVKDIVKEADKNMYKYKAKLKSDND